jgi:hypothetical protein
MITNSYVEMVFWDVQHGDVIREILKRISYLKMNLQKLDLTTTEDLLILLTPFGMQSARPRCKHFPSRRSVGKGFCGPHRTCFRHRRSCRRLPHERLAVQLQRQQRQEKNTSKKCSFHTGSLAGSD